MRAAARGPSPYPLPQGGEGSKESTPKDPTIRARFNSYRFADHKEKAIDLLMRVTRVSVETMKIVEAMRKLP